MPRPFSVAGLAIACQREESLAVIPPEPIKLAACAAAIFAAIVEG